MLITRETDYALRLLRALADGERHTMKLLCESEEIPQQFAYKILRKLSQAGMVQSVRGAEGGVALHCDLRQRTLYDVVQCMEADKTVSACMTPGYRCRWVEKHRRSCTVHCRLCDIQDKLDRELQAHTLQELLLGEA